MASEKTPNGFVIPPHPGLPHGPGSPSPAHRMRETAPKADPPEIKGPTSLPIRTVRCPKCENIQEHNCHDLEDLVKCEGCATEFTYVDGYLNFYKEYIEIFVDQVHALPLSPGYSTSGSVQSIPDDLLVVDFGISYKRPPEVFFLVSGNRSAREWISDNQVLLPLSISEENFILFSHSVDRSIKSRPATVTWMAIGEMGNLEKPLWLNYLQNSADLVRKEEDVAAIVMLMIALDFYYDYYLNRLGFDYEIIRKLGRRPGMNEKRAKLKLLAENVGSWPESFQHELTNLTDYRNQIVHGVIKRDTVRTYSGRRAFQIVLRAILFLIEMFYNPKVPRHSSPPASDHAEEKKE